MTRICFCTRQAFALTLLLPQPSYCPFQHCLTSQQPLFNHPQLWLAGHLGANHPELVRKLLYHMELSKTLRMDFETSGLVCSVREQGILAFLKTEEEEAWRQKHRNQRILFCLKSCSLSENKNHLNCYNGCIRWAAAWVSQVKTVLQIEVEDPVWRVEWAKRPPALDKEACCCNKVI